MKYTLFLILLAFGLYTSHDGYAQKDSVEVDLPKERALELEKPTKAAFLSAVLPGAGQAYNKKYWKVPIIYAGVAGFGYAIRSNHNIYVDFRNALNVSTDGNPATVNRFPLNTYNDAALKRIRDTYRRYRDLSIILSVVFYGLNIADAVVDAHLGDFDVSPDLSAKFTPVLLPVPGQNKAILGLSMRLGF